MPVVLIFGSDSVSSINIGNQIINLYGGPEASAERELIIMKFCEAKPSWTFFTFELESFLDELRPVWKPQSSAWVGLAQKFEP